MDVSNIDYPSIWLSLWNQIWSSSDAFIAHMTMFRSDYSLVMLYSSASPAISPELWTSQKPYSLLKLVASRFTGCFFESTHLVCKTHFCIGLAFNFKDGVKSWRNIRPVSRETCNSRLENISNPPSPLLSTILPYVRPWTRSGSDPGPAEKANVHAAVAVLSSKPASSLHRPSSPRAE